MSSLKEVYKLVSNGATYWEGDHYPSKEEIMGAMRKYQVLTMQVEKSFVGVGLGRELLPIADLKETQLPPHPIFSLGAAKLMSVEEIAEKERLSRKVSEYDDETMSQFVAHLENQITTYHNRMGVYPAVIVLGEVAFECIESLMHFHMGKAGREQLVGKGLPQYYHGIRFITVGDIPSTAIYVGG